jgi:hypothetical protein
VAQAERYGDAPPTEPIPESAEATTESTPDEEDEAEAEEVAVA